jgi:hypothetical protein
MPIQNKKWNTLICYQIPMQQFSLYLLAILLFSTFTNSDATITVKLNLFCTPSIKKNPIMGLNLNTCLGLNPKLGFLWTKRVINRRSQK